MGIDQEVAEAEAKLAMKKAEQTFARQKASSGGATVKQKLRIRAARFEYRTAFPTAGTVNPGTVATGAKVGKPGS